jgi:hypothetical protein
VSAVEQFLLFRPDRPSNAVRSIVIAVLMVGAAFAFDRRYLAPKVTAENDGHALAALDMALTRVLCGAPSAFSLSYRAPMIVRDDPSTVSQPMRQLLIDRAGSLDAYCLSINQPFVNNENSLMVAEVGMLRINPNLSYEGMGRLLHATRVAGLAFVAFVLLESGFSIWMSAAVLIGALAQLNRLDSHVASVYPFLFVLVIVAAAAYAHASGHLRTRGLTALAVAALAAGGFSSFGVNMRTSYFPVYVAMFGVFLWLEEGRAVRIARRTAGAASLRAAVAVAAFALGYWLFQYVFISRHIPPRMTYNSTSHSIAHPLVLALAVPETDFSRREGIHWQDSVGGVLATRTIPGALYLGPRYDEALFKYYRDLWRTQPREMAKVYLIKAHTAGKHMLRILRTQPGFAGRIRRLLLAPIDLLPDGIALLALYVALSVLGIWRALVAGSEAAGMLALASVAAVLLHLESAIIMSLYVPNYHSYLAVFVIFIGLWGWQWLVNTAWRLAAPPLVR